MNQAPRAEELDRFSPFIISVSLMLLGIKNEWGAPHRERERCHLHKGVESVRLAPVEKYSAVGKKTETE